VRSALGEGYRHIDTARIYGNEADVGRACRESGLPRSEIFVTTKLWYTDGGRGRAERAFEASLDRLGLEYVDLYLIHWPEVAQRVETWEALVELTTGSPCRAVGVSNFTVSHLEELLASGSAPPSVNQVEFHPFLYQKELLDFCRHHHIQVEAYSPLAKGLAVRHPLILEVAQRNRRTQAQVVLRWGIQHGLAVIPKSTRLERIRENAQLFDFQLSAGDMAQLDGLHEDRRTSWDPTHVR
jgi:diketogulonate reductase-like aldo/keto reductase